MHSPACLAEGIGLLATLALVPFVSQRGTRLHADERMDFPSRRWRWRASNRSSGSWSRSALPGPPVASWLKNGHNGAAVWGGAVGCLLVLWLTWTVAVKPYAFGPGALLSLGICLLILGLWPVPERLHPGGYLRCRQHSAPRLLRRPVHSVSPLCDPAAERDGRQRGSTDAARRDPRALPGALACRVEQPGSGRLRELSRRPSSDWPLRWPQPDRSPGSPAILRAFSLLPIITPPFVVGMAIILLFGLQGFVTSQLLGLKTRGIFGFPGLALAQTLSFAPVAFLVIASVVESINPALEEASLTLRAGRWQTFWKVTLPLLRPGIANAFLLTIIESLADFGNPIIIGGEFEVLSTEIYFSIVGRFDQTLAATLGLILLSLLPNGVPAAAVLAGRTLLRHGDGQAALRPAHAPPQGPGDRAPYVLRPSGVPLRW